MASIMIVEDDSHQARLLSMWLGRNGHEVQTFSSGRAAQAALEGEDELSPDLIISDVNMPEMNGVELATWLRNERGWTRPIMILSSRCDQENLRERLGGFDVKVHPKPFSPTRLVSEVESLLSRAAC